METQAKKILVSLSNPMYVFLEEEKDRRGTKNVQEVLRQFVSEAMLNHRATA